jgi:hypothetical protein
MWQRTCQSLLVIASCFLLAACSKPLLLPELSTRDVQQLRDGGYCTDAWGRHLSHTQCSQLSRDLARKQYKAR